MHYASLVVLKKGAVPCALGVGGGTSPQQADQDALSDSRFVQQLFNAMDRSTFLERMESILYYGNDLYNDLKELNELIGTLGYSITLHPMPI